MVNGNIVALVVTSVSMDQKNTLDRATVHIWYGLNIVD